MMSNLKSAKVGEGNKGSVLRSRKEQKWNVKKKIKFARVEESEEDVVIKEENENNIKN